MEFLYIVLGLLLIVALAVLIGKFIKGDRTDEEQAHEDNDQAAYLAAIDKPHSRVNDLTSPVTGRYERKADPVTPHGSRKVVSSTPGLAGAGPLNRRNDDLAIGGMTGGALGYGLGYDSNVEPGDESTWPVYDEPEVEIVDLTQYDEPVTVTEPAHVVEPDDTNTY